MIKSQPYKFEPGAMTIVQMGEELIGHPSTALSELVKNAYDADAITCRVYIHVDPNPKQSFLFVHDDGLGMANGTLFGEWLQPSMSVKRLGDRKSRVFGRALLGSKGIGRLAAMALGRYLTVVTKTKKEKHHNWIALERDQFKQETLLSKISFPGGTTEDFESLFHDDSFLNQRGLEKNPFLQKIIADEITPELDEGTFILIEQLDDSLQSILKQQEDPDEVAFEETGIMLSLRSLITPLDMITSSQEKLLKRKIIKEEFYTKSPKDKLSLWFGSNLLPRTGDSKKIIEFLPVEPLPILKGYDYRALGKVDENGNVVGHYSCRRLPEDKRDEKFSLTSEFVFSEENLRKKRGNELEEIPQNVVDARLREFFFDIRVYDRDPDSIEKLSDLLKRPGKLVTRRTINNLLGFRVSKNGFGVKPYGEEEKDWMGLGQIRVQDPAQNLTPNQILGYVFLFDVVQTDDKQANTGLSEKTNREGFFENRAFISLKQIIRGILMEIGRRRYHYRLKHNLGRTIRNKLKRPNTKAYLDFIEKRSGDTVVIEKSNQFIQEVTTALDSMENTLTFSQRLATLGSGLELVYHEMATPIAKIGGMGSSVKERAKGLTQEELRKKILADIEVMCAANVALDTLKESLRPAIGLSRRRLFKPFDTFQKVCVLLAKDISDDSIDIEIVPSLRNYEIKDYEYALWVAFLNILNNAVYWLKSIDKGRRISFTREHGDALVVQNTGPKIPDDYLELIFEYGVTLRQEKNATGLGLAFTKNVLGSHGWEITAENRDDGPAFLLRRTEE